MAPSAPESKCVVKPTDQGTMAIEKVVVTRSPQGEGKPGPEGLQGEAPGPLGRQKELRGDLARAFIVVSEGKTRQAGEQA